MHLNTINIYYILFSIGILGYFIYQSFVYKNLFPKKKYIGWILFRMIAILSLILVLFGSEMVLTSKDTTTLFLVDRSLSCENHKEEIEKVINNNIKDKKNKDEIGVITFGKEPMIEIPLTKQIKEVNLQTKVEAQGTNIQKAIDYSLSYFPKNRNKRLILFTDGEENMGSIEEIEEKISHNHVNMSIYPLKNERGKDVELKEINLPTNIHIGENAPVTVHIRSNIGTQGEFYLFENNEKIIQENVKVEKGENEFTFNIPIKEKSTLKGEINFLEDENGKNNICTTYIDTKEKSRILLIGENEDVGNIRNLLSHLPVVYEECTIERASSDLNFLSSFDSICMVNIPYEKINKEFEKNINTCVKEQGTGLLFIGGENTFSLGGYKNTLFEKVLPVNCKMKENKKKPNTGLVLLIDVSGSMEDTANGVKKIEMAKEAAIRSIDILDQNDEIGILAFSDKLEWIVPMKSVKDKENIKKEVGRLKSGGGTLIQPGIYKGIEKLKDTDTKIKHMILLTDGQGEKEGYEAIVEKLKEQKITLSTVALGQDSEKDVLKKLGYGTKGRNYIALDYYTIPEIFAKETYLASKKYLNQRTFTPKWVNSSFLEKTSIPSLKGYIGTGIKSGATLLLKSDEEDPILASWKYGLGNVVVWTSDLNGKWSHDFILWDQFEKMWSKIINYTLGEQNSSMKIETNIENGDVEIFVETGKKGDHQKIEGVLQGPNEKENIFFDGMGAGKFYKKISLSEVGEYALTIKQRENGKVIEQNTRRIKIDYSPEDRMVQNKLDVLKLSTDEEYVNEDTHLFSLPIKNKNKGYLALDFILLPVAILAFIGDIWIRKR
ncbi:VWA domain-containing protein [Inediibacterium massiliense]|uniref:VWA domain-containing protein n=1 Tax=Inediibacterium massiliense TaxID=1658111 RepID=UPI0006B4BF68|nr:VWA domain-containing protein [Inediibacterium massiliense]